MPMPTQCQLNLESKAKNQRSQSKIFVCSVPVLIIQFDEVQRLQENKSYHKHLRATDTSMNITSR